MVVELARSGFTILPTNQSQVSELLRCCKKLECLIYDAWDKVINSIPEPLITANAIAEVLGFPVEEKNYRVPARVDERLTCKAIELDMSKTELHHMILDWWMDEDDEPDESESTEDIEPDKIEAWETDVDELVTQHDHQT